MKYFLEISGRVAALACIVLAVVGAYVVRWDVAAVMWGIAIFAQLNARCTAIDARIETLGEIVLLDAETEDAADREAIPQRRAESTVDAPMREGQRLARV